MKVGKAEKIIIVILALLLIGYFTYYKPQTSSKPVLPDDEGIEITLNDSQKEIALFCQDLENKLIEMKTWDTDKWKCVVAYDEGYNTTDIIYNKTRGLCNCTATFKNGVQRSIEVRQAK